MTEVPAPRTPSWEALLSDDAPEAEQRRAWKRLRDRFRRPVVHYLQRRLKERRATEEFAAAFFDGLELREEFRPEGAERASFRAFLEAELPRFLQQLYSGRGEQRSFKLTPLGAREVREGGAVREDAKEFEKECARSLLLAALRRFRETHPEVHALFLRLHDRPEGAPPLTPEALADRLDLPADEVREHLEQGRRTLQALFRAEVDDTAATPPDRQKELAHLLPHCANLL